MKIQVISIGKVKQSFVLEGEQEYLKRLKPWVKVEVKEISSDKFSALPLPVLKEKEAGLFLAEVQDTDVLVVLDEQGKSKTTEELADFFRAKMNEGVKTITLGIGGAAGWDASVKKKASIVLSLSPLTFPYQLCRLMLIEQIYRVYSLIKGAPYHKA